MTEQPLPLTAFDRYMWTDDGPAHPMSVLMQVEYTGRLDRAAFEAALRATLAEHPLLRSTIDESRRRTPVWRPVDDPRPLLSWADADVPLGFPDGERIDLTREIGLRVWVREGGGTGRIVFQFHHACTDGLGVVGFTLDVLQAYGHATGSGSERVPRPARNAERLVSRGTFPPQYPGAWGRVRSAVGFSLSVLEWRRRTPVPLTGAAVDPPPTRPMQAIRSTSLDAGDLERLLRKARDEGVTLNDLLVRDLLIELADVCAPRAADGDCLRVCVPVSLREPEDRTMPAANKVTMSFVNRSIEECRDGDELLRGLHRETREIRARRGLRFIAALRLLQTLCGGMPAAVLHDRCLATAVLSNLGRIDRANAALPTGEDGRIEVGGVTVDRFVTAPAGRSQTSAVIVALTYAGELTLCLRFDPRTISATDADGLLRRYRDRVRATAEDVPVSATRVERPSPATRQRAGIV